MLIRLTLYLVSAAFALAAGLFSGFGVYHLLTGQYATGCGCLYGLYGAWTTAGALADLGHELGRE